MLSLESITSANPNTAASFPPSLTTLPHKCLFGASSTVSPLSQTASSSTTPTTTISPTEIDPNYILQTLLRLTIIILHPLLLYHPSLPPLWQHILLPLLLTF